MADFYVVGNAAYAPGSGRNGSQASPWVWGVDTIVGSGRWGGGDVLYLVPNTGWDAQTAVWSVPNHINSSDSNRAIIDGSGVVELGFVNAAHFAYNVRANTVIRNFKKINALLMGGAGGIPPANCAYIDIGEIASGNNLSGIAFTEGHTYNVRIARIGKFTNMTAPDTNGTRAAILWRPGTTVESSLNKVTIEDCHFESYEAIRGIVSIMTGVTDKNRVYDLTVQRLTFKDVTGLPCDIECAGPDSGLHPALKGTIDWSRGIKVRDICGVNVACKIVPGSTTSYFGGLVFISGFGNSTTPGFGQNEVGPLYGKNLSGDAGLCDLLYGTYQGRRADFDHPDFPELRGKSLWVDTMSSPNIDANALLYDVGCHDCNFEGIYARRLAGSTAGKGNAGAVVMYLDDAPNCHASGVDADDVKYLLFVGATGSKAGGTISNFTVTNVASYLALIGSTASLADSIELVNGVVDGNYAVRNERGASKPWKGLRNCFLKGSSAGSVNHTFGAENIIGVDPMLDPDTRRPLPGSPLIGAGKYTGRRCRDATGRKLQFPLTVGAYDRPMKSRALRV